MTVVDQLAPAALISHAWRLVGDEPLGTAEHALDLRRAVSSAYYAVFHEICRRTAGQVTGRGCKTTAPPDLVVAHLVRAIPHGAVASACRQVDTLATARMSDRWSGAKLAAWHLIHSELPAPPPDLLGAFAANVTELRGLRHKADYDRLAVIEYDDAASAVDGAEETHTVLRDYGESPVFQGFFALVAMAARGAAERMSRGAYTAS